MPIWDAAEIYRWQFHITNFPRLQCSENVSVCHADLPLRWDLCSQIVICLKDNRGMVGLPTALSLVWVNTGKPVSHVPKTLGAVVFREGTVHKVPSTWDATIGVSARETSWTDSTLSLLLPPHQGRREAQEEYLWEGISSLSYSLWHPQDTNFGIWLRES